jgi:DNA-directed RNA polymerase subunit RPC12/RpoP
VIGITGYFWNMLLCKARFCNDPPPTTSRRQRQRRPRLIHNQNPMYPHFHVHLHFDFELSRATRKIPLEEDRQCSITLETIESNESYIHCSQCHKNFLEEGMMEWLRRHPQCPHCRHPIQLQSLVVFKHP